MPQRFSVRFAHRGGQFVQTAALRGPAQAAALSSRELDGAGGRYRVLLSSARFQ